MKRLLCIVSSLNTGGAETFLMKLYRKIDTSKYQMDFVVNEPGVYDEEVKIRGGCIFTIPLRTNNPIGSFSALRKIVKKERYNYVLKLSDTPIGVIDLIAAKLGGAKRIGLRSCNTSADHGALRKIVSIILKPLLNSVCDYKLAPSTLAAEFTFGKRAVRKGEVLILKNGLDTNSFRYNRDERDAIRAEFALQGETIYGNIGRFSKQKNHDFLLKVFKKILERDGDSIFMLVGTGELEEEIREKSKILGLENHLIFAGIRKDIPAVLSAFDVFILPSLFEGMPNTVIEAQAAGLPCLIADTITREAKVTDLVQYCSLNESAEKWAKEAIKVSKRIRKADTHINMMKSGYDISDVVCQFVEIVF